MAKKKHGVAIEFSGDARKLEAELRRATKALTVEFRKAGGELEKTLAAGFRKAGAEIEKEAKRTSKRLAPLVKDASGAWVEWEGGAKKAIRKTESELQSFSKRVKAQRSGFSGFSAAELKGLQTAASAVRETGKAFDFVGARGRAALAVEQQISRERVRTAALAAREYQRHERERLRTAGATARASAREYEKELGAGFFSRLGSSATAAFKRTFGVGGGGSGGDGGGGLISGALSVATGNILTSVLGAVKDKITGAIKVGFDYNRLRQSYLLGYESKLKSRPAAEAYFNRVSAFASEESPLKIPEAQDLSNRLLVAFNPDETITLLRAAGDQAAALGKVGDGARETMERISTAFLQIKLKGRVSAEEMTQQLTEAGVNAWGFVGRALKEQYPQFARLSEKQMVAEAMRLGERGALDSDAVIAAIVRGIEKEFGGMGREINLKTVAGKESNLEDRMQVLSGVATGSAFEKYGRGVDRLLTLLQSGAAERLAGGISMTTGGILDGLETTLRAVASGDIVRLGEQAVTGAADGARRGAKSLYDAGAGAAGQLERGWRDRLDQHSPSRVLDALGFEAGLSLLHGFNKGMLQGQGNSRERIDAFVREAAERFKVPPELIHAVIKKESSYHAKAVSPMGARGLMQLMPATAARFGVRDSFDPRENVMGGTRYLSELLKMFGGDVRLALAAYNAGEGAVLAHLPNRPDVNSYVGGSGKRWTVSEETARRTQGVPNNGQTPEYVATIMRDFSRFQSGGTPAPVPVTVQNLPPLSDFFSQFVGKGYAPAAPESDAPASRDLRGGTGMFVGDFNPRGFAERLYEMHKATPAGGRATVAGLSDWEYTVSLLAEEFKVSRGVRLQIEGIVARRLEDERRALAALAAQGARDGGHFVPGSELFTPEAARRMIDARRLAPVGQDAATLAQTVTPQALASARLAADETRAAFEVLPPLIKESTEQAERFAKRVSGLVSDYLGGALHAAIRRDWKSFFDGLRDDALDFVTTLAKDRIKEKLFQILSPNQGGAGVGGPAGGGGFSLKNLFGFGGGGGQSGGGGGGLNVGGAVSGGRSGGFLGAVKGLFGFGSSAASGAASMASAAGPMVNPAAFVAEFGAAPALGGGGAAAGAGGAGGFGSLMPLLTNPWTAVAVGAAVGGFMLWKHFSKRDEKALKKAILSEYQIDLKSDWKTLGEIKRIGEQTFGKGKVRKHLQETIRLDQVKDLLSGYAEQTGQTGSKLLTDKQLGDAADARNNFIRRASGGPVEAGRPYIVGDGGPRQYWEVFVPGESGHIEPSVGAYERRRGTALKRAMERVRAQAAASSAPAPSPSRAAAPSGGGMPTALAAALAGTLAEMSATVKALEGKITSMSPGDVVGVGARQNPAAVADGAARGFEESSRARRAAQGALGLGNS